MKKTVGVFSLIVMLLSQVMSPFVYAVSGEEVPIPEPVVEEVVPEPEVEESEVTESEVAPEVDNSTGDNNFEVVEPSTGEVANLVEPVDVEVNTGTVISTGEETKNLEEEGTESSSGFIGKITETIRDFLGINGGENSFESHEIYGTGEYGGVKVEVYAQTGLFASGTELTIEPVVEEKLQSVQEVLLSGEVDLVEEQVIAFDITFRDPVTQEEIQPKNGTVQVTFNYEENGNLVQAEEKEDQEVKVYHLNDIDEEGNKIEELTGTIVEEVVVNEEESEEENVMVVEAESFSVYTIVVQVKEEWPQNQLIFNFEYGEISIAKPSSITNTNYPAGFTIMDRNLGAMTTGVGINAPKTSYGYHYQWGNNYGFDSSKNSSQISTSNTTFQAHGEKEYSGSEFIIGDDYWRDGSLPVWDEGNQGPCPVGWHIPKYEEWNQLYQMYNNTYSNSGIDGFINYFNIPYAGYRSYNNGSLYKQGSKAYFWGSTWMPSFRSFDSSGMGGKFATSSAYGYSVRCFKNEYNPVTNENPKYRVYFDYYGGRGSVAAVDVISGGKVQRPTDPVRNNSIFSGWYISGTNIEFNFDDSIITSNISLYAKWNCEEGYTLLSNYCSNIPLILTYDSNGGLFEDGEDFKNQYYRKIIHDVKYSHTKNIDDSGTQISNYTTYMSTNDVVSIPGSDLLHITIVYGSSSSTSDFVSMRTGSHPDYKAYVNYKTSIIGKLGGGNHENSSNTKEYFIDGDTVTFSFRSEYSSNGDRYGYYAIVEGVSIMTSDDNEVIENPTREGYEFLGRYEEGIPEYFNFSGGITKDTLLLANWGLIGGGNAGFTSTLLPGQDFNIKIKTLAKGSNISSEYADDYLVKKIKRAIFIPEGLSEDKIIEISSQNSEVPVLARFTDGTIYYYTEAKTIYMNEDSANMFLYFKGLETADLSIFDTSHVKNMRRMFYECNSFTSLDIGDWDTSNVTDMSQLFYECSNLTSLDIGGWDTSSVADMNEMFYNCSSITSLDIGDRDTSSVTDMSDMFEDCSSLISLDISNWNTSSVTDMSDLFEGCSSLTSLDLNRWNTSNVTKMSSMFYDCSSLTSLNISNWDTSSVTRMSTMFSNCSSLTSLNISNWDTSNVENMRGMFRYCRSLTSLDISRWDTSNVVGMDDMFNGCKSITSLDIGNWDTSKVTDMNEMFYNCSSITSLDLNRWNTSKVVKMDNMFDDCSSLTGLDISNWNTSSVTDMNEMFEDCSSLTSLDIGRWDTSNVADMNEMFYNCSSLTNLDLSRWNTSSVTNMSNMFYNCSSLTSLDVSNWDTSSVTSMSSMFSNCSSLTGLDVSSWDTSSVTSMSSMFSNCGNLGTVYAGKKFRTSNATNNSYSMFYGVTKIVGGNGTVYDSSKTNSEYARIDSETQSGYFTQSGVNTQLTAYLLNGQSFNRTVKSLANDGTISSVSSYTSEDRKVLGIQRALTKKTGVETIISSTDSEVPIYAWYEDGIIYYHTIAEKIYMNGDSSYMFYNFKSLLETDLTEFDTSSVSNMYEMFRGCSSLTGVNVNNWNTINVNSMYQMFYGCENLIEINLSNRDTKKVGNMYQMFAGCSRLRKAILKNWDINRSYSNMSNMFSNCTSLIELVLDGWDLSKISNPNFSLYILSGSPIKKISVRNWKMPVASTYSLFNNMGSSQLEEVDVSGRDLSKTKVLRSLFDNSQVKRIIGINTWTGTNEALIDMFQLFQHAYELEEIDMSNMDLSKVNTIHGAFWNDENIKKINLSNTKFDSLKQISNLCNNCKNLEEINLSNININTDESDRLFLNAYNLKKIKLDNFGKVTSTRAMFQNNYSLTGLDLSGLDTSNATKMDYMFYGATGLRELNMTTIDTSKVTNMEFMFYETENLKTVYVSEKFNTDNVETSTQMFSGAVSLVGGNGTIYDPNNVDVTYARIDNEYQSGYFTDPNHFAVKFITATGVELLKQWIGSGQTVEELEDSHRNYRYYTSGDLQTGFDFTKPLYAYTEIYVTRDDVKYVTYEYGTGVEKISIYTGSCVVENGEDRSQQSESCEVALPELNVLTGYHTPMWYKKGEDITYSGATITLTGDIILEAKAIANNYTVVYQPGEGTGEMESQEFEYDKAESLNKNKYRKEGYHFSGWIDMLGKEYRDGEKVLNLLTEGVLELTAQWLQNPPAAGGGQSITPATKEQEHNAAEEKQNDKQESNQDKQQDEQSKAPENTNTSNQTTTQQSSSTSPDNSYKTVVDPEIQSAYEWAYERDVTTIPSLDEAMPDGVVKRGHLAKMVVNYATNVLGREIPEKIPSECRWNDWRKDWESEEIKDYAVKSCALGLMGLDMPKFLPNMEVTRAQFGTIMSRLLWGKKYAGGTPYYRKHLNALKENGIMTQIENPERRVELRQWVWIMLMRSAANK